MTQGAVKTAGKRSQAVSAKSTPSSVRRWRPFHSSAFTARAEQVAEQAGVSKTNLLYYYPSKEALYVAVMQQIRISGWRR